MPELLHLMGANDILFPYAMSYMHYINIFLPVAVFSNYVAIFIRADNDPNRAMAGVLLGGVVNIALDIIFVFPLHMGMGGAAFASVLGMTIQVIVGGSHFFSRRNGLHFIRPIHNSALKQFRLYYGSRSLKTRMQLRPCHRKSMQVHGNRPQVIS